MKIEHETVTINGIEYVRADSIEAQKKPAVRDGMRYGIVRSREDGVKCGWIVSIGGAVGRTVTLLNARQIWRYDSTFVLVDIADHGMRKPEVAMLSCAAPGETVMLEACGVIYCSEAAAKQLMEIPAQNKKP